LKPLRCVILPVLTMTLSPWELDLHDIQRSRRRAADDLTLPIEHRAVAWAVELVFGRRPGDRTAEMSDFQ
jgi:hypothetical protein